MKEDASKMLRSKVRGLRGMPAMPAVLKPLLDLLCQPSERIEINRVVDLVSYDKSIAAQCLRVANSPLYSRGVAVESVRSAVLNLGMQRIKDIAMSCTLNQVVPLKKWSTDPAGFWRHSLGCALVSKDFAEKIGHPNPDLAYLSGLLHDVGILVNTMVCTDAYRTVVTSAAQQGVPLAQAELEILGFTHCESGKILANAWNMHQAVAEVIEFHHEPEKAPAGSALVNIVHLSDLLCRMRNLGYGYVEWQAVELAGDPAWSRLAGEFAQLAELDLARFTLDLDATVERVTQFVDEVFGFRPTATVQ